TLLAAMLTLAALTPAQAGEATVEGVVVTRTAEGTFRFDVTVAHADTGWEHYADAFVVTTLDGEALGTRTLFHPHVEEQPFTRSLSGVAIPEGMTEVLVHAHDNVDGAGPPVRVAVPQ
ncbi:MAG: hypothetical protein AAFW98_16285, partial [Pseudomonadota bacterium]